MAEETKANIDELARRASAPLRDHKDLFFAYANNETKVLFTFIAHLHLWLNAREVAAYTGIKVTHVYRYLDLLLADGVITVRATPGGSVYRLNPETLSQSRE